MYSNTYKYDLWMHSCKLFQWRYKLYLNMNREIKNDLKRELKPAEVKL